MNWTDERVELLKKLWAEGLSASQIAAQLGGVSRNAVIGKVHRLKLSSRGRATAAPARQKKTAGGGELGQEPQAARPRPSRTMTTSIGATALQTQFDAEPIAQASAAAGGERGGADLAPPAAHPAQRADLQMAERRSAVGGLPLLRQRLRRDRPYCSYHARIAFQPASERRRSR